MAVAVIFSVYCAVSHSVRLNIVRLSNPLTEVRKIDNGELK